MNLTGLLQLVEPTCTDSDYATYFGLLEPHSHRPVHSLEELHNAMTALLADVIGPTEGVAAGIAFRAMRAGEIKPFQELIEVLSNGRLPTDMCATSLRAGTALWERSRRWQWATPMHEQLDSLTAPAVHHAAAFGALASETTANELRAIATYLYRSTRLLISASSVGLQIDETTARHLLTDCQENITTMAVRFTGGNTAGIAAIPREF